MFYFEELNGQKILRSDLLDESRGVNAFFTTRGVNIPDVLSAKHIVTPEQTHSDHVEKNKKGRN